MNNSWNDLQLNCQDEAAPNGLTQLFPNFLKPASSLIRGVGIPSPITGVDNDYYLNTETNIYYFKVTGAWSPLASNIIPNNVLMGAYPNKNYPIRPFRQPSAGRTNRVEVVPVSGIGGIFELWDIAGVLLDDSGFNEDVARGNNITQGYLNSKILESKAKQLWRVEFKGDGAYTPKVLGNPVTFSFGLAARYLVPTSIVSDAPKCKINLICEGGFSTRD